MCYIKKTWHCCKLHYKQESQYCHRATVNSATDNRKSCENFERTSDEEFTKTFCNNANCFFTRLEEMFTCCQCHRAKNVTENCTNCEHICCNNCTTWRWARFVTKARQALRSCTFKNLILWCVLEQGYTALLWLRISLIILIKKLQEFQNLSQLLQITYDTVCQICVNSIIRIVFVEVNHSRIAFFINNDIVYLCIASDQVNLMKSFQVVADLFDSRFFSYSRN